MGANATVEERIGKIHEAGGASKGRLTGRWGPENMKRSGGSPRKIPHPGKTKKQKNLTTKREGMRGVGGSLEVLRLETIFNARFGSPLQNRRDGK